MTECEDGGTAASPPALTWPSQRRAAMVLGSTSIVLGCTTLAARIYELHGSVPGVLVRLDASQEANLPTWFASVLLLSAGVLALSVGSASLQGQRRWAAHWVLLGGLLTLMSADETGQFHENTAHPAVDLLKGLGLGKTGARVTAGLVTIVVIVAACAFFVPWAKSLGRRSLLGLVVGAGVYFGGAAGLEVVSRLLETVSGSATAKDFAYVLSAVEETCEMLGMTLVVCTLLPHAPTIAARRAGDDPR